MFLTREAVIPSIRLRSSVPNGLLIIWDCNYERIVRVYVFWQVDFWIYLLGFDTLISP